MQKGKKKAMKAAGTDGSSAPMKEKKKAAGAEECAPAPMKKCMKRAQAAGAEGTAEDPDVTAISNM